ncbi:MAG: hypothetical protein M3440_11920 [Chloroflexota bacterium]|nr:hypothetical protein [Chloroflexota bacterium]
MTTLATHIRNILLQDAVVVSNVADRVFDFDIRLAGPDAVSPRGPAGFLATHIIVDDAGGVAAPLAASGAYLDRVVITIIAEGSATGRQQIEILAQRLRVLLHRWQEPNSKAFLAYSDRSGISPDPPPGTGALERLTFGIAGVTVGIRS